MRDVVLLLADASRDEVERELDAFAVPQGPGFPWIYPGPDHVVLYLGFHDPVTAELDGGDLWPALLASLGGPPSVVLIAGITGRVPGDVEVRAFVAHFLSRFRGVAEDGYTDHYWSLAEVQAGTLVDGLRFFDTMGYHARRTP